MEFWVIIIKRITKCYVFPSLTVCTYKLLFFRYFNLIKYVKHNLKVKLTLKNLTVPTRLIPTILYCRWLLLQKYYILVKITILNMVQVQFNWTIYKCGLKNLFFIWLRPTKASSPLITLFCSQYWRSFHITTIIKGSSNSEFFESWQTFIVYN